MLRKCKKLFSSPFSRTQNTAFSPECDNVSPNMENKRKHPFTLIIFAIRSRLFSANTDKCKPGLTLRRIHTRINSRRITENRQIPKIYPHSRTFSHKLTSNRENWFAQYSICPYSRQYSSIFLPIFVNSTNLKVPKMYSEHNVQCREPTNILIRTLFDHLFLSNVLCYSPRIHICVDPALHCLIIETHSPEGKTNCADNKKDLNG